MNILYVSAGKIPSEAANSVHVMKMAQAFALQGHNVTLAHMPGENLASEDIFSLYAVRPVFRLLPLGSKIPFLKRFMYAVKTVAYARRKKMDLVFCRCIPSAFISVLFGLNTMLEMHDSPNSLNYIPRQLFYYILKAKTLLGLVVISSALKKHIHGLSSYPDTKILTLHDGADPVKPFADVLLKGTNYKNHIGYTGHLYKGRGIEVIIELADRLPHCFFHIVGGNLKDIEKWEGTCSGQNVHFYGHVPHNSVADYIASFDILLAPYQEKVSVHGNHGDTSAWMSPLKIFEYMASGKPIVCSDIPVLREILQNGVNSVLCPANDIVAWKNAIETLLNDKNMAESIGAFAKADFESKYTWEARAKSILSKIA